MNKKKTRIIKSPPIRDKSYPHVPAFHLSTTALNYPHSRTQNQIKNQINDTSAVRRFQKKRQQQFESPLHPSHIPTPAARIGRPEPNSPASSSSDLPRRKRERRGRSERSPSGPSPWGWVGILGFHHFLLRLRPTTPRSSRCSSCSPSRLFPSLLDSLSCAVLLRGEASFASVVSPSCSRSRRWTGEEVGFLFLFPFGFPQERRWFLLFY